MADSIELISFKLCPFVQRSVITLLEKGVPFDITYIDLSNKPDWFLKISPTGKVPVLRIGDTVLFESAVINEYLDEVTPPSLHPSDPLEKARHRAWIEYLSTLFMNQYRLIMAKDKAGFEQERDTFVDGLARLEEQLADEGPWFAGARFSLVDTAGAPLMMRTDTLDRNFSTGLLNAYPKLQRWSDALLARESVKLSVVEDFEPLSIARYRSQGSWVMA